MDEVDKDLLERLRLEITNVLHVEDVLDYLRFSRILTANDDEIIRRGHTRTYRCDLLLDILPTRGETAYDAFVEALEFVTREQKIDGYRRLIKKLKRRTEDSVSETEEDSDDEVRIHRMVSGAEHGLGELRIVITSETAAAPAPAPGTLPHAAASSQHPCSTITGTNVHLSCEQQICDLVQQRNLAREEISILQRDLAKYEHLEKDHVELKSQLADEEEENKQRFVELRHALEQNYVFSRELDRLNGELDESNAEMERLRRIQAETNASEGSTFRFRDLYTEVSAERDDLKKKLGVEMATTAELTAKVETTGKEITELRNAAQEERHLNASLREQLKLADIEVKFERHNSLTWRSRLNEKENRSSSKELSDLTHRYKQRCEDLNLAAKEMKELRNELELTTSSMKTSTQMLEDTERRCMTQSKVLQELGEKYGAATNESRNYKSQLHRLAIELQEVQNAKDETQSQCRILQDEMLLRDKRAENIEELHARWRNDMDTLLRQLEEMRQDRDKTKSLHLREMQASDTAKNKAADLQHRFNQSDFNYNKCKAELNEAKQNGFLLEYQLHQLASIVNNLLDSSEAKKLDQDRARLHLTLHRAVVAGNIPEGLQELEIPKDRRLPIMEIALNKADGSSDNKFGLSLESHIVVAKSQVPSTQNYRDLLLPGDRILKVNGFTVTDQQVSAVDEYLQQSPPTARLLIFRSPTSFLSPVGSAKIPLLQSPAQGSNSSSLQRSPKTTSTMPRHTNRLSLGFPIPFNSDSENDDQSTMPSIIIQKVETLGRGTLSRDVAVELSRRTVPVPPSPPPRGGQDQHSVQHHNHQQQQEHVRSSLSDGQPLEPISLYNSASCFSFSDTEGNAKSDEEGATYPVLTRPGARRPTTRERIVRRSSSMGEFDRLRQRMNLMSDSASDDSGEPADSMLPGRSRTDTSGKTTKSVASRTTTTSSFQSPSGALSLRSTQERCRRRLTPTERRKWRERHVDYMKGQNGFGNSMNVGSLILQHRKTLSMASLDADVAMAGSADDIPSRCKIMLPKGSTHVPQSRARSPYFHIDIIEHRLEDPLVRPTDRRISMRNTDSSMIPGHRIVSIPLERIRPLNIQLAGGRGNGVYIEDIRNDMTALPNAKQLNLKPGDQLLRLGNCDLGNATYEMAATAWKLIRMACTLCFQEDSHNEEERCFSISVRDAQTAYKNLPDGVRDAFFLRITRAVDRQYVEGELRLETGALYHVVDTMYQNKEGQWRAHRISETGQVLDTGCIPSASVVHMATKAPTLGSPMRKMHSDSQSPVSLLGTGNNRPRSASAPMSSGVGGLEIAQAVQGGGGGGGNVSPIAEDRRKSHVPMTLLSAKGETATVPVSSQSWMQRIKRELWQTLRPSQSQEDPPSPAQPGPKHLHSPVTMETISPPVYEVVERCRLLYARPVIIVGAMADRLMHQLLHDPHSSCFVNCTAMTSQEAALNQLRRGSSRMEFTDADGQTRIVAIQSIHDLSKKQKHSVFANVSTNVVSILQSHCLHPIVVRIVVNNISHMCFCLGVEEGKAGQILQQGNALAAQHMSITDTLVFDRQSDFKPLISELKELVTRRQNEALWIAQDEQLHTQPLGHDDVSDWLQSDALTNGTGSRESSPP
eukprot:scpid13518/ scgid6150/ 